MFEEQPDILFTLQMACIQQLNSPAGNYIPRDIISKLKVAESLRSFWTILMDSPHCNFLDVRLLEAMAAALLKPEAKKIINNFKNTYYNKTIAEVAPTVPIAPIKSMHCVAVHDNLDLDPNKTTIFELYQHRFYIEEILEVDELIGCHKIRIGSINIIWQIPINFVYKAYCSLRKNLPKLHPLCELLISDTKQWEKLPVLWHGQQVDDDEIGPIKPLLQHVRHKPYTLHSAFRWSSLKFRRRVYAASIAFPEEKSSYNCTMWITTHPGFWNDLYFGVRVCATNKLVGVTLSYPLCIAIGETRIKAICIYQKSHVKYMQNRLPYMLIQESMRRVAPHGIQHACFGFYTEAIKPLVIRSTWCYNFFDPSITLPLSIVTPGWREMKLEDVPAVLELTNQYTSRFKIRQEFQNEKEFSHYFLNSTMPRFIFTYIVEDLSTGEITDMVSFRKYRVTDVSIGEMVAIVAGKTQPCQLITDTLVCASKQGLISFQSKQFGLDSLVFSSSHFCIRNISFSDQTVVLYNYQHPQIDQNDSWIATLCMKFPRFSFIF